MVKKVKRRLYFVIGRFTCFFIKHYPHNNDLDKEKSYMGQGKVGFHIFLAPCLFLKEVFFEVGLTIVTDVFKRYTDVFNVFNLP